MFKPVSREKNLLRMALDGPAGSGKTYTALRFAFAIAAREGGKVALIDTEHGSSALYSGESPDGVRWEWDGVTPEHFAPSTYTAAIEAAGRAGYRVLVIDSLSHAWMGTGGALAQVDKGKSKGGGSFGAWRDVTPQHNQMVDAILRSPCHVIATMRTKTEFVLTEEKGKTRVEKVGLKPIQRDGVEYEFTIVCDLDQEHRLTVSKTRFPGIDGKVVTMPTAEFVHPILDWLYKGSDPGAQPAPVSPVPTAPVNGTGLNLGRRYISVDEAQVARVKELWKRCGKGADQLRAFLDLRGASRIAELTPSTVKKMIERLELIDLKKQAEESF